MITVYRSADAVMVKEFGGVRIGVFDDVHDAASIGLVLVMPEDFKRE
jgi:hypothetical protein